MSIKEYIICSAIHFNTKIKYVHQPRNIEEGLVICGRRYHNCFMTAFALNPEFKNTCESKITQGFLTNLDRFVDRYEGYEIAINAGQTKVKTTTMNSKPRLFSEDLY
jgi:hypothetical protein